MFRLFPNFLLSYIEKCDFRLHGAIGGLLGTGGGASGTSYKAPAQASIATPTTGAQLTDAGTSSQAALAQQQALLQALQGNAYSNPINNQQDVIAQQQQLYNTLNAYNPAQNQNSALWQTQGLANNQANLNAQNAQGTALNQQQGLNAALTGAGVNGINTQQGAISGLQGLAGQYQGIANGTGPNPAQAMLNQQTGQNVAQQAALMAGQRGASQNVGLIARQAGQQGANIQQQAVGQGASMQAQQSLAALQGLGQTQSALAGLGASQVGQAQSGIGAAQGAAANITAQQQQSQALLAQQAQAQLAAQQGQQAQLAGQANTMVGQQIGQTVAGTQAAQAQQGLTAQQLAAQNQALVGSQQSVNAGNTSLANTTIQGQQGLIGGAANAIGGALSALAHGGEVKKKVKRFADGGYSDSDDQIPAVTIPSAPIVSVQNSQGPQSSFGKYLKGLQSPQAQKTGQNFNMSNPNSGAYALQQGIGSIGAPIGSYISSQMSKAPDNAYTGPDVDESPSTKQSTINPALVAGTAEIMAAKGGQVKETHDYRSGGKVVAKSEKEKAVKAGDSYSNDKIPAVLSEHEIVLPRSVVLGKDPINSSAKFVAKILARRKKSGK